MVYVYKSTIVNELFIQMIIYLNAGCRVWSRTFTLTCVPCFIYRYDFKWKQYEILICDCFPGEIFFLFFIYGVCVNGLFIL